MQILEEEERLPPTAGLFAFTLDFGKATRAAADRPGDFCAALRQAETMKPTMQQEKKIQAQVWRVTIGPRGPLGDQTGSLKTQPT